MRRLISAIDGYKTYIAAAGFAGLAVYHLTQGEIDGTIDAAGKALAAAGLRHAIAKASE